ncbi:hypothetical protein BH23PSE1_BH23PSE1_09020 [soil metagenome]
MAWAFSWLRTWDEVWDEAHLAQWTGAYRPGSGARVTPFMHPGVVRAWIRTHGEDRLDPFFLRARHPDGRLVLMAFVRRRASWRGAFIKTFAPVGGGDFDYNEPIVLPSRTGEASLCPSFWPGLAAELEARAGAWFDRFERVKLRAPCLGGADIGEAAESIAILRLDPYASGEAFLMSRSKKLRKWIRRIERGLAEEGALAFTVHAASERDRVLDWIPAFVAERGRRHSSSQPLPVVETYFANLVREGIESGIVHCSSITLDGRALSWEVNFHLHGIFYGYSCAFDPAFSQLSPGSLHNFKQIEWLIENGSEAYDFMRGADAYKESWTDGESVPLHHFDLASAAPSSLLRLGVQRGLRAIRQLPRRSSTAREAGSTATSRQG